ncbi:hypothetical protein AFCA_011041 [Aspergillus flavus]|nr:hypothetical protein COH21_012521 [Aspergillus flavus]UDD63782.1 hypothetical protein AFCA_011041 [Aspergillus flavus]
MKEGANPFLEGLQLQLHIAIRDNHAEAAVTLIDQGVPLSQHMFLRATRLKSYVILKAFIHKGWDINACLDYWTPPALAFALDDETSVNWFLENGANPDAQCDSGCTSLSMAVKVAPIETIKLLLSRGGTIKHGWLLHYVAMRELADCLEVLDYLLGRGLLVNNVMYKALGTGTGSALHFAAGRGQLDIVRRLVEKGADTLVRDPTGQLAIHWAQNRDYESVVDFLRPLSGFG